MRKGDLGPEQTTTHRHGLDRQARTIRSCIACGMQGQSRHKQRSENENENEAHAYAVPFGPGCARGNQAELLSGDAGMSVSEPFVTHLPLRTRR